MPVEDNPVIFVFLTTSGSFINFKRSEKIKINHQQCFLAPFSLFCTISATMPSQAELHVETGAVLNDISGVYLPT